MNLRDQRFENGNLTPTWSFIDNHRLNQKVEKIEKVIRENRLVEDRVRELENCGFDVSECPMGSGGVGQMKVMKDHVRIQIGYGHSKYNYAYIVNVPLNDNP